MSLYILFHNEDIDFRLQEQERVASWLKRILEENGFSNASINYIFTNSENILRINQDYLNHDYFTDIITFDLSDSDTNLESDIYVCIPIVMSNSKEIDELFESELKRVLVHGILHLIGFSDKSEAEAKIMREKENHYLELY